MMQIEFYLFLCIFSNSSREFASSGPHIVHCCKAAGLSVKPITPPLPFFLAHVPDLMAYMKNFLILYPVFAKFCSKVIGSDFML